VSDAGSTRSTVAAIPQVAAMLTRPHLVGRETERATFMARLGEAMAGRGGLVMLAGEPGIGKSRAAEEFASSARGAEWPSRKIVVMRGRCYEGRNAAPYGPFVEALTEYVEHARVAEPESLRHDLGYGAVRIARLVPALRELMPDLPEPTALLPEEEHSRLLDMVSQFLVAASGHATLVIALDDLQWADEGTIAMLLHLAPLAAYRRILIIGAYRDMEIDPKHPLSDHTTLDRATNYKHLPLSRLDDLGKVSEIVADVAKRRVPETLLKPIAEETKGNPSFILHALLMLAEEGIDGLGG
jgi:predicted ATPase